LDSKEKWLLLNQSFYLWLETLVELRKNFDKLFNKQIIWFAITRYANYQKWVKDIEEHETGYDKFTRGFEIFGLNVQPNGDIIYREWAPNARAASLIGEFSK
jgi:hypothetical protein